MTTSTTSTTSNQIKSRVPSSRDFEIFRLAEITGLTHAEIALTSHKLTRRRISQIVARVRRWLSLHPCQDPRLASELQRKQLARHTERMHLEHVISQARGELIYGKKELTTTTTKDDGTSSTTTRQQPFNVQVLKTYLRAVQALAKLQQQPDVNLPTPEECPFPWLKGAINEVYDKWFDKIWSGKLKPEGIVDLVNELGNSVLKALTTQQRAWGQEPSVEGQPAREAEAPAKPTPLPPGEGAERSSAGEGIQTRSASEGNVRSISIDPSITQTALDDASRASQTSLREAPTSQQSKTITDCATDAVSDTYEPSQSAETTPPTPPASQKNPNREAPPPALASGHGPPGTNPCPSIAPSSVAATGGTPILRLR